MRSPDGLGLPARPGWPALWLQVALAASAGLLAIQVCRLAGLGGGMRGWILAAALYLLAAGSVAMLMQRSYPHRLIGICNLVTLIRAALVAALLPPLLVDQPAGWTVAAVGAVALALDGVDGWFARRSGLASAFGARFDMEVDSAFALILSIHALAGTHPGPEVLALGAARYLFLAATLALPWLDAPLPQRIRRKAVCVLQLGTLLVLQLPVVPPEPAVWLARIVAGIVIWSFAVDIAWLWRHRA